MNKAVVGTLAVVGVLAAAGGGYWFGTQKPDAPTQAASAPAARADPAAPRPRVARRVAAGPVPR